VSILRIYRAYIFLYPHPQATEQLPAPANRCTFQGRWEAAGTAQGLGSERLVEGKTTPGEKKLHNRGTNSPVTLGLTQEKLHLSVQPKLFNPRRR